MEWDAPAIVLAVSPYGESGALATVMTAAHGTHRGLARGGSGRRGAGLWQPGNLLHARWLARLPEQLGTFTAELAHPTAALAMADPASLSILSSACATAAACLPEREPHPRSFEGLLQLLAGLDGWRSLPILLRWEAALLTDLGYGLDLSCCAATGVTDNLAFVSPRTGRAVSAEAAGPWRDRLLALPALLLDPSGDADSRSTPADWLDGLALTGHFLRRDVLGAGERNLPAARELLAGRVSALPARVG